MIDPQT
jgi:dynein heavy chain